jgi:hypothetical protein
LREPAEYRRLLLDTDFLAPRESALTQALAARIARPSRDCLHGMTLADRHWLIAQVMLRDGTTALEVAEVCSGCGELLELRLDLADAIRDATAAIQKGVMGLRLPTARDVEGAETPEDLLAACALGAAGDPEEIEERLRDADPLGTIALNADCCQCGRQVRAEVDLAARWLASARRATYGLLEEVHALARRYHWTEREILGLSEARRQFYIELCQAEQETEMERFVYA